MCYECNDTHLPSHRFCPVTGVARSEANTPPPPGVPASWRDNPNAWEIHKTMVERMSDEELGLCGLRRLVDSAGEVHPDGPHAARAYRTGNLSALNVSMLPTVEGRDERPWQLIGPYMQRELFLVQFVALYLLGPVQEDELRSMCQRIINEWHGLPPDEGFAPPEGSR